MPVDNIEEAVENHDPWTGEEPRSSEGKVIRREMNGCIREIIGTLPETYRSVIILGDLEGMTDREIADVLGIRIEAAKIRLHRARAKLREELASACVFYRDDRNELACDRRNPPLRISEKPPGPEGGHSRRGSLSAVQDKYGTKNTGGRKAVTIRETKR